MKFLHTSDWHIGRTLNGFSLLEEQKYAFEQILSLAKQIMLMELSLLEIFMTEQFQVQNRS